MTVFHIPRDIPTSTCHISILIPTNKSKKKNLAAWWSWFLSPWDRKTIFIRQPSKESLQIHTFQTKKTDGRPPAKTPACPGREVSPHPTAWGSPFLNHYYHQIMVIMVLMVIIFKKYHYYNHYWLQYLNIMVIPIWYIMYNIIIIIIWYGYNNFNNGHDIIILQYSKNGCHIYI